MIRTCWVRYTNMTNIVFIFLGPGRGGYRNVSLTFSVMDKLSLLSCLYILATLVYLNPSFPTLEYYVQIKTT